MDDADFQDLEDDPAAAPEGTGRSRTQPERYADLQKRGDWALCVALLAPAIGTPKAMDVHRLLSQRLKSGQVVHADYRAEGRPLLPPETGDAGAWLRHAIAVATPRPLPEIFAFVSDRSGGRLFTEGAPSLRFEATDLVALRRACNDAVICFGRSRRRATHESAYLMPALRWNLECLLEDLSIGGPDGVRRDRQARAVAGVRRVTKLLDEVAALRVVDKLDRAAVRGWVVPALREVYDDFRDGSFNREMSSAELAVLVGVFGLRLAGDLAGVTEERLNQAVVEAEIKISVKDMVQEVLAKHGIRDASKIPASQMIRIQRELLVGRSFELIADEKNTARDLAPLLKLMMDRDHQERETVLEQREQDIEHAVGFFQTLAEHLDSWIQGMLRQIELETGRPLSVRADPVSMLRRWMAGDPALMRMLGVSAEEMKAIEVRPWR